MVEQRQEKHQTTCQKSVHNATQRERKVNIFINRLQDDGNETLGKLYVYNGLKRVFKCCTLELPYKDNKQNVSCIPCGRYSLEPRENAKHGKHLLVEDVQDRSWILIHSGNFNRDTEGCILVGRSFVDIDGDGHKDVSASKATLAELIEIVRGTDEMELIIS